jgi:predicted glycosyltransferase involved in capsule biosynthesis
MLLGLLQTPQNNNDNQELMKRTKFVNYLVDKALQENKYCMDNVDNFRLYFIKMKTQTGYLGLTVEHLLGETRKKYDELRNTGQINKLIEDYEKRKSQETEEFVRVFGKTSIIEQ